MILYLYFNVEHPVLMLELSSIYTNIFYWYFLLHLFTFRFLSRNYHLLVHVFLLMFCISLFDYIYLTWLRRNNIWYWTCDTLSVSTCVLSFSLFACFIRKLRGVRYAKKWSKIKKIQNAVTYSSLSLLQGCPLKVYIKTFHCHHKI